MAFADTVEFIIPYSSPVTLDEILSCCNASGFQATDGRLLSQPKENVTIRPRKNSRQVYDPAKRVMQKDTDVGLDSPLYGIYRNRSFGWLKFSSNYLYVSTTLGYWIRGHNWLMDNARTSSEALRELLTAIPYYFPFVHPVPRFIRIDATYQLKIPAYSSVAPSLFSTMAKKSPVREDVFMHKSYSVSGLAGKTTRWSCYDKGRQVKETANIEIPELTDVVRLTETVYKASKHMWGSIWEDEGTLELSQEGMLYWLRRRWDGVDITNYSDIDITGALKQGVKYTDIAARICMFEHPDIVHACREYMSARVFNQSQKRLADRLGEYVKYNPVYKTIQIPQAAVFSKADWKPVYYLEEN